MEIYKTRVTPKNQVFKLQHAWDILKDCPRWGTDADQQWGRLFQREAAPKWQMKVSMKVSMKWPHLLLLQGPREEISKRKQREKGSPKIRWVDTTGIAKLNETHSARQEESARMRLQMKEISDREQDRFEINLIMEDLNKYTPERKKFLRGKQKEILRKSASRSMFQDDESSEPYIPSFNEVHHQVTMVDMIIKFM